MSGETKKRIGELEAEIARLKAAQPTLRDQFAMAAMSLTKGYPAFAMAAWAYEIADAMIEVRNGTSR